MRLGKSPFIHFDSNDYSAGPAMIGCRVDLVADLARKSAVHRKGSSRPRKGLGAEPDDNRSDPYGRNGIARLRGL